MQKWRVPKMLCVGIKLTKNEETKLTLDASRVSSLRFLIQINVHIKTQRKMLAIINALTEMIPDEITNRQSEQNDKCNLGYFHGARVCLTSRAQAQPPSGTLK